MTASDRRARTRDAIIVGAERVVEQAGLAGFKAREIASAAQCSLGVLYYHFADLDELVLTVNVRTLATIDGLLEAALSARSPGALKPEHQLSLLAGTYLDYAASHLMRWQALFDHHMAGGRAVPEWYGAEQAKLFRRVEQPIAALLPGATADRVATTARTVFAAIHGVVALGLHEKLEPTPARALRSKVQSCVEMLTSGIRHL